MKEKYERKISNLHENFTHQENQLTSKHSNELDELEKSHNAGFETEKQKSETVLHETREEPKVVKKYKMYSLLKLTDAYNDVKNNHISVSSAAKKYGVPEQTLRDRVKGRVDINVDINRVSTTSDENPKTKEVEVCAICGKTYSTRKILICHEKRHREISEKPAGFVKKYRQYSVSKLAEAYKAVKYNSLSVIRAAKKYGVPEQTLRDRVKGKIDIGCITSGRASTFSPEEDTKFVRCLEHFVNYGYVYLRKDIVDAASDYAFHLGKREPDSPFSNKWYDAFRKRWPELQALKNKRTQTISAEAFDLYFNELEQILDKYSLNKKPHLIFNVDEIDISDHVLSSVKYHPQAVCAVKPNITTIIACGSAGGVALPPFFIFPGKHMSADLLKGATPGVSGVVSDTGCSSTEIFRNYLFKHFIKYVPQREPGQYILLLLDGHVSHVAVDLMDWAKSQNIILHLLPAQFSNVLQPLEVGCHGPLKKIYGKFRQKHIQETADSVTRYDKCGLLCKAYHRALFIENLISAFSQTGVYPFKRIALGNKSACPEEESKQRENSGFQSDSDENDMENNELMEET